VPACLSYVRTVFCCNLTCLRAFQSLCLFVDFCTFIQRILFIPAKQVILYPEFVSLSVCLSVSNFTQKLKIRIFMKILPGMHLWTRKNRLNLGINNPPPDPDPGIFKDSLAFRDSAFFHTLAYISEQN